MDDAVDLDDLEEDDSDRAWFRGEPFTGQAVETYRNGVRASLTSYVKGHEEGLQKIWREDGTLETESTLRRGNAVGAAFLWHPSGALAEETVFDDEGRPRTQRRWDETGRLVGEEDWTPLYDRDPRE